MADSSFPKNVESHVNKHRKAFCSIDYEIFILKAPLTVLYLN